VESSTAGLIGRSRVLQRLKWEESSTAVDQGLESSTVVSHLKERLIRPTLYSVTPAYKGVLYATERRMMGGWGGCGRGVEWRE